MGVDQSFRVLGEAGAGLPAGEHCRTLKPSGFLGLDRALAGLFGFSVKRSWGVVLRALIH